MRNPLKSLKFRIAASIFILEAIMMVLVLGQTLSFSRENSRLQLKENEQVVLDLLADMSKSALFTTEFGELQQYIDTLVKDPHIVKVIISNRDKRVVVSTTFNEVGKLISEAFSDTDQRFWRTRMIGDLGTIAIQFSNEALIEATWKVTNLGIKIALTGMMVILFAGTFFGLLLTRKLSVVIQAAERMATGDLEARTGFAGQDEIAVVGMSFDRMAEQIKRSIDELELRVEERTVELRDANAKLHQLSTSDQLTGIANRRMFDVTLEKEFNRSRRKGLPISLLMMDIDFFKYYNDHYGHVQGDFCLTAVAQAVLQMGACRATDLVARYGGEEFAAILPETEHEGALIVAERILNQVRELKIPHARSDIADHVTVSIGVYTCEADSSCCFITSLIDGADKLLYEAKQQGRNRVAGKT